LMGIRGRHVSGMDRDEGSEVEGRVPSWLVGAGMRWPDGSVQVETILTHKDSKGTCTHRMASDVLV